MLTQTLNQPHPSVKSAAAPRAFANHELVRFTRPGMTHLTGCVLGYRRDIDRYEVHYTEVHVTVRRPKLLNVVEFFAAEELVAFKAVSK